MNYNILIKVYLFVSCISINISAQNNLKFKRISIEEGLSQVSCMEIYQDKKGLIWIGTQEGLNMFDGYDITVFKNDPNNKNSISHNWITSIKEDKEGNLWVGTQGGGLEYFNTKTRIFTHYINKSSDNSSISNNFVTKIISEENGNLWIGTRNGLNYFDIKTKSFQHFTNYLNKENFTKINHVTELKLADNNTLFIGTQTGLFNFNLANKTFNYGLNIFSNKQVVVLKIFQDNENNIWVGTSDDGLFFYDRKNKIVKNYLHSASDKASISRDNIGSILQDRNGNLWVGTWIGGLNLFDKKTNTFKHYKHKTSDPFSLSNNFVSSLMEDNQGNLWVGTWLAGLNVLNLNNNNFIHYNKAENNPNSLNHNIVRSLYEDKEGNLWIATFGGLNFFDQKNGKFKQYTHQANNKFNIVSNFVRCLYIDNENKLWIGTRDGLDIFNRQSQIFQHFKHSATDENSLSINDIIFIYGDSKENIWLGTRGGGINLYKKEKNEFIRFKNDPSKPGSLSNDWTTVIREDKKGNLWVGTRNGLNLYDYTTRTFTYYKSEKSNSKTLSNNWIMSLHADKKGRLWVGTRGGLNLFNYNNKTFTYITEKDGLSNNVIYGILEDENNNLWLSTNKGINKFNPETKKISWYDVKDGLQSNEFNTGAYHKGKSGKMYFGGVNGFNVFKPEEVKENAHIPPVILTNFLLFNQPVEIGDTSFIKETIEHQKEITLKHNDYIFGFEFSALNYVQPEKNQFAYLLEGFDKDWTYTSSQFRRATYTNIPNGTYTFRVKASNDDGVWNETGKKIIITILPPPWLTWWAKTFYFVLLIGVIYLLIQGQKQKIKRKEHELLKERQTAEKLSQINKLKDAFLANTSHELKTPLNGIIGLTESLIDGAAGEINKEVSKNLQLVVSSGKRLSGLINDILDFSKLKNKQLEIEFKPVDLHILSEIVISFSTPLISDKEIVLINKIPKDVPLVQGDENRLQQILLNLIDNAIKYTEKGKIEIASSISEEYLIVSVSDTGIGISEGKFEQVFQSFDQIDSGDKRKFEGTGIGLSVTKQLVELHNGKIWIKSKIGEGATFCFSLILSEAKKLEVANKNVDNTLSLLNPPQTSQTIIEGDDILAEELETIEPLRNDSNYNILIVDDEPINLKVLENYLTLQNFNIYKADNGERALDLLNKTHKLDLVILDIMMPKLSGYDVCKKIREKYSPLQLPVILLTAKNLPSDLIIGFKSGANDYLSKPFSKDELLLRIKTQLQLVKANRELEGYSLSLENKVKERTIELKQKSIQLEKTNKIVKSINTEVNIGNLLNTILLESKVITGVERASALLYDNNCDKFKFKATVGWNLKDLDAIEFTNEETFNRYVRFSSEIYEDVFISEKIQDIKPNIQGVKLETPKAMLILQICIEKKVKAYFIFDNMKNKDAFNVHDIELIKHLKEHIISAIIKTETVNQLQQTFIDLAKSNKKLKNAFNKLKKLDEFKEVMTGMIIHDFKNDLNTIIGFTEGVPNERRIKSIRQAGRNMLQMALNILDVQKFENTSVELSYSQENVSEAIKGAIEQVQFLIEQKYIKLTFEIDPCEDIEYDFDLIKRTVLNILINAIKYTPNNGQIHIQVNNMNTDVYFSIKDSGLGIQKDKLNTVFDKFAQVKTQSSGVIRSTGLGLTFCKMVVEAHKGKIGVNSEYGKGSEFWFTLPFQKVTKIIKTVNSKIVSDLPITNDLNFSNADREILEPYINKLKKLEVYDFSDVSEILSTVKNKNNPAFQSWLIEMQKALRNVNQKKFEELINL